MHDGLTIDRNQYLELEKLAWNAFLPLTGFMNEDEFRGTVNNMRLPDGSVFPLPVVLALNQATAEGLRGKSTVTLVYEGQAVGTLSPESIYTCDKNAVAKKVYGTDSSDHPGAAFFFSQGDWFVGGPVTLTHRVPSDLPFQELRPDETRDAFRKKGWETIAGFQTRNVPHRAHEYLQRVAMEYVDGLMIHPLIGWRKPGDYTPESIVAGYQVLIDQFYRQDRVFMNLLSTNMRYAGPREAVFHAIVRRNYGCTHFIVGRDHAGVGNYYEKYAAHQLTQELEADLGITIMRLHGPYYCARCDGIVTEKTCPHEVTDPDAVHHISATDMRNILSGGQEPPPHLMRKDIVSAVSKTTLFIDTES